MAASAANERIILSFGWKGPSSSREGILNERLDVKVVNLVIKNAISNISVNIPENISPSTVRKLPFTFRRGDSQATYPDSLNVKLEQIHNLTIQAGIYKEQAPQPIKEIQFAAPKELEIGKTYCLVITSNNLTLSARLLKEEKKEEKVEEARENNRSANTSEFKRRVGRMGEALIVEGMQNLNLAFNGGSGVFDSSTTTSDVFAHGMQGVIRSGQQMNSEIRVPYSKPSESPSDLNRLTKEELQSRFEATFIKDKEFESQRMQAAFAGNIDEMNRIMALEHANSQLLINLGEALERKGIKPQIPQSNSFQTAANQSAEAHAEALNKLTDQCATQ